MEIGSNEIKTQVVKVYPFFPLEYVYNNYHESKNTCLFVFYVF